MSKDLALGSQGTTLHEEYHDDKNLTQHQEGGFTSVPIVPPGTGQTAQKPGAATKEVANVRWIMFSFSPSYTSHGIGEI